MTKLTEDEAYREYTKARDARLRAQCHAVLAVPWTPPFAHVRDIANALLDRLTARGGEPGYLGQIISKARPEFAPRAAEIEKRYAALTLAVDKSEAVVPRELMTNAHQMWVDLGTLLQALRSPQPAPMGVDRTAIIDELRGLRVEICSYLSSPQETAELNSRAAETITDALIASGIVRTALPSEEELAEIVAAAWAKVGVLGRTLEETIERQGIMRGRFKCSGEAQAIARAILNHIKGNAA